MTSGSDLDATFGAEPDTWHTGTPLDEFTPIYLQLARNTKTHGPIAPGDVDALDLTLIAHLLGVEAGSYDAAVATDLADLRRRAEAGEAVTWGET